MVEVTWKSIPRELLWDSKWRAMLIRAYLGLVIFCVLLLIFLVNELEDWIVSQLFKSGVHLGENLDVLEDGNGIQKFYWKIGAILWRWWMKCDGCALWEGKQEQLSCSARFCREQQWASCGSWPKRAFGWYKVVSLLVLPWRTGKNCHKHCGERWSWWGCESDVSSSAPCQVHGGTQLLSKEQLLFFYIY